MNTETITLKNESYTVPAEIGGFLMACPVCGKKSNLCRLSKEDSCSGTEILPGYSLDAAMGFEIQDYSDVVLRYVPWDEDFDLEFTQTLHLEKGEASDGFEITFLENQIMDFMRDFIHEKLLQGNNYVRLMRQFERSRSKPAQTVASGGGIYGFCAAGVLPELDA